MKIFVLITGLFIAFILWACCVVAARADRWLWEMRTKEKEKEAPKE